MCHYETAQIPSIRFVKTVEELVKRVLAPLCRRKKRSWVPENPFSKAVNHQLLNVWKSMVEINQLAMVKYKAMYLNKAAKPHASNEHQTCAGRSTPPCCSLTRLFKNQFVCLFHYVVSVHITVSLVGHSTFILIGMKEMTRSPPCFSGALFLPSVRLFWTTRAFANRVS